MSRVNLLLLCSLAYYSASAVASDVNYDDLKISAQLASAVYCANRDGTPGECSKDYIVNGEALSINWFTGSGDITNDRVMAANVMGIDNSEVNNTYNESSLFWRELHEASLNNVSRLSNIDTLSNSKEDYFQTLTIYDAKNNTVYIAFRGSDNIVNWLQNILIDYTPFEEDSSAKVHTGFYKYLRSSLTSKENSSDISLAKWLKDMESEHKPNYTITGHSLGGAGAVLLSAKFINEGIPAERIKLITYGQPAVGTWGFLSKYQGKITNYVRVANMGNPDYVAAIMGDPVVTSTAAFKYYQFGTAYSIAIDTNYSIYDKLENYPDSLKYSLSLHDSFNYTDFIVGCNILSKTCSPQLRKSAIPRL